MTAQEWLDELERLRKAATPGPWKHNIEPLRAGLGFIRDGARHVFRHSRDAGHGINPR